jgi:type IV secretion system protein VirD4
MQTQGNLVKVALYSLAFLAAVVSGVWIAGALFLAMSSAAPVSSTTLKTFASYAYWHSSNPKVEAMLYLAGLVGALVALLPVLPLVMSKRESLHGDARWATHREVKRAGLIDD